MVVSQRSYFKGSVPTTFKLLAVKIQSVHRVAVDTFAQSPQPCKLFLENRDREEPPASAKIKIEANIIGILFLSGEMAASQNTFKALIIFKDIQCQADIT